MIPALPAGFSHPVLIGKGAFASVLRVRHKALERWVALKLLYEKERDKRRSLLGEARTQAMLHADCVPQVYDAFEWRGNICTVMEWIRGLSLASALDFPLDTEERVSIAASLVQALAAIHAQGFAHRDLKPQNIIISPGRGLFLVDFGFTKKVDDLQVSSVAAAKGTPAYMAPELWSGGGKVDLMRADIFALGRILMQILENTPLCKLAGPLLSGNPMERPASGVELLALWDKEWLRDAPAPNWNAIAGQSVAERLSETLSNAAKELLHARRTDEAYWLLVESIEENGNNRKALELMKEFQNISGARQRISKYLLFSVLIAAALGGAFFAGMKSRQGAGQAKSPHETSRGTRLAATLARSTLPSVSSPLREDSLRIGSLDGRILIRSFPEGGTVFVDSTGFDAFTAVQSGLSVRAGEHLVTIRDSTGFVIRRERINLLPFQTAVVDAAYESFPSEGHLQ